MNNKGQALVLVILLIPILMLIITGSIEMVNASYQKTKISSNIKTIIKSCYEKCSDEEIKNLLNKNAINYEKLEIKRDNNLEIDIKVKFAGIIKNDYLINLAYVGQKNETNVEIKRVS